MKTTFLVFSVVLLSIQAIGQVPKSMSIVMIGKTNKPILDVYIADSTTKNEFKFDEHTVVLYTGKNTLGNIYSPFENEKRYDSLTKYDYSFGTFSFVFRFENSEKVKVIATRIQSVALFKKIIGKLSSKDDNEGMIIKEIDDILRRINY